jgi:hypothetical protein
MKSKYIRIIGFILIISQGLEIMLGLFIIDFLSLVAFQQYVCEHHSWSWELGLVLGPSYAHQVKHKHN